MAASRSPKRIPIERLREALGDRKVDEMLSDIYGDRQARGPYLKASQLQAARHFAMHLEVPDSGGWSEVEPVLRAYYGQRATARKALQEWIDRQLHASFNVNGSVDD